jgi:hypothetical protein
MSHYRISGNASVSGATADVAPTFRSAFGEMPG